MSTFKDAAALVRAIHRDSNTWQEGGPPAVAALIEATTPTLLGPRLDDVQCRILGMMVWHTGPIAHLLRDSKLFEIPPKCEHEQAFVMHWLLGLYAVHGERWKDVAEQVLADAKASIEAAKKRAEGATQ